MIPAATLPEVVVKPHPRGGWTHARRVAGAGCYVYSGNWPTAWAATRALGVVAENQFGAVRASGASPANSDGEHGGGIPSAALSSTPGVGMPAPLAVAGRAEPLFPVITGAHWSRALALARGSQNAVSVRLRAALVSAVGASGRPQISP